MTATHVVDSTVYPGPVLYLAFELGWTTWKLAFTVGLGQQPRIRSVPARDLARVNEEILAAKKRFGLSASVQVVSCYEAGAVTAASGWIAILDDAGIRNIIVDSSSIEVNRRKRRAKSDRLGRCQLVNMLVRWHLGEHKIWCTIVIPASKRRTAGNFTAS